MNAMKRILLVLLLLPLWANAQIISLIAGGGTGGDGTPAISASINDPGDLAFDKWGNLYFSEGSNKIRKIDTAGIITTIAGTGIAGYNGDNQLATLAQLNGPNGIAFDTLGNLYITDAYNSRIRKIDITTGIITTFAGNGNPGFSGDSSLATAASLNIPNSICFDKRGNLYIGDDLNYRIRKVNTAGIIATIIGTGIGGYANDSGLATAAECLPEYSICTDNTGNLYIASGNQIVLKMDTANIITNIAGDTSLYIYNGDGIPAIQAHLTPSYLAIDDSGLLYISDALNNRIRKIDANDIIHTIAGNGTATNTGNGGLADSATIHSPSGIAFDACGNLYIANVNSPLIRKVTFNPSCPDTTTSVNNIPTNQSIHIYPNPANDVLHIDNASTNTQFTISNMLGMPVLQGVLSTGTNSINVSALPPGLYVLQLMDNGNKKVRKIIKQ